MKADTLACLCRIANGGAPLDSRGVTVTPTVTPEKPGITPVTPVTPFFGESGKAVRGSLAQAASEGPDLAKVEERAGMASDSVPTVYLDAWARLDCQKPARVPEAEWRLALDDGGRFLDVWGEEAAALGWTAGALFDVASGLIWRLGGERVAALGADHARLGDGRTIKRCELSK